MLIFHEPTDLYSLEYFEELSKLHIKMRSSLRVAFFIKQVTTAIEKAIHDFGNNFPPDSPIQSLLPNILAINMVSKDGLSSICPGLTIQSIKCPDPGVIIFATRTQSLARVKNEGEAYSTFGKGSISFIIGLKLSKLSSGMDMVVWKRTYKAGKAIYENQIEV